MGQAVVAVELEGDSIARYPLALEFPGQLHTLREGEELAGVAVEEAERRQALQVVPSPVLVVWVTIDNTCAPSPPASCSEVAHQHLEEPRKVEYNRVYSGNEG